MCCTTYAGISPHWYLRSWKIDFVQIVGFARPQPSHFSYKSAAVSWFSTLVSLEIGFIYLFIFVVVYDFIIFYSYLYIYRLFFASNVCCHFARSFVDKRSMTQQVSWRSVAFQVFVSVVRRFSPNIYEQDKNVCCVVPHQQYTVLVIVS